MAKGRQMLKEKFYKFGLSKILKRARRGQGVVEFAIVLPILLVAFFTIIELARVYHAWVAVENGARFGVRYAITGEFDETKCDGGSCDNESEEQTARVSTVEDVAWAGSQSIIRLAMGSGTNTSSGFFDVTVCEPTDLVGPASQFDTFSCTSGESAGEPGDHVAVVVEYNHPLIVPVISSIVPQIRLTAQREATVETFREVKSEEGPGSDPPAPQPSMTPPATTTVEPDQYDYCENIIYGGQGDEILFWDESMGLDERWKLGFKVMNNNEDISMYLTAFEVHWDQGTSTIQLYVFSYDEWDPARWYWRNIMDGQDEEIAYCRTTSSGNLRHCGPPTSNIEFVPRPNCPDCESQTIYGWFCNNRNDCERYPGNPFDWPPGYNQPIVGSNYNFFAQATFTFLAADTGYAEDMDCVKTWEASGNAPDMPSGGGGGGGEPWDPGAPDPPGGGGGGGADDPSPPAD
jgi:hypothetical protein